jgi:hypothetical protein
MGFFLVLSNGFCTVKYCGTVVRINSIFFLQISDDNANEDDQQIAFEIEDFWRTGEEHRLPSTFLQEAIATGQSNQELVALHYWFVSVLWLIMGLSMKSVKPLSLLGSKVSRIYS